MKEYINLSNRKIIRLLKQLKQEEISNFLNYLRSIENLIEENETNFISFLANCSPHYDKISKDALEKFFEKDKKKVESQLSQTLYRANRLLEKWLIYREIDKDKLLQQQLLTRVYANYLNPEDFFKIQRPAQKVKIESELGYPDYFYTQFKIESTILHYPHTDRFILDEQLTILTNNLDHYYVGQKLRLICQQISRSQFMQEKIVIPMYDAVIAYANERVEKPYFQLYLNLLQLIKKHDDVLLSKVKNDFLQHHKVFTRLEQAIFLHMLINHLVLVTNVRQLKYLELRFELYRIAVNKDLLLFNNGIADEFFYNILQAACYVKDFDFAEGFIQNYGPNLTESTDSNLISFANALIAFHKKKFKKTESILQTIQFKKNNFKLMYRLLRLKCLYELCTTSEFYYDFTVANAQNFQKFIKPHKVFSESKKQLYLVFIKYTLKLIRLKNKPPNKRTNQKKKILEELTKPTLNSASKNWLIEKVKIL